MYVCMYVCHTTCHTTSVSLSTYCDITMATTVTTILVKEVVSMQMANMADHVSGKYYTVSTCGHSLIHMCTCMKVIIRSSWEERYT